MASPSPAVTCRWELQAIEVLKARNMLLLLLSDPSEGGSRRGQGSHVSL